MKEEAYSKYQYFYYVLLPIKNKNSYFILKINTTFFHCEGNKSS
ncbi:hypothetical protein PROSTU_02912 [Providencia stuartii ATCC 25827]|uniref:Uncharacterized protein n=1 Tax=Providencia stuartii ATCC 25827 TaxID=471874 RepID=A0AA86YML1_PROST|nr:hypothetical protein PROSTU_02912 [Providencia stuartii ATCC 25827]